MWKYLEQLGIYNLGPVSPQADEVVLYAPLSCSSVVVSPADLERLESAARGENAGQEYAEILEALATHEPIARLREAGDFTSLSILPTDACNFACSYCYSAKGRSSRVITYEAVEQMIRYFVGIERKDSPALHVTIFGGGEPMLCWEKIVRPAIELIEELRQSYAAGIHITLITNGSMLPPDFIEVCKRAKIDLAISFEILEELQNRQRRNFRLVSDHIATLCAHGVVPAINSVITDEAAARMPEMVEKAVGSIPGVKYLSFEPVTGEHSGDFYAQFGEKFFEAKALADAHGVNLTTSALRNVDVTVMRYCAGELALNASGEITACPCLSSPEQPGYRRWVYGSASAAGVSIDHERLRALLSRDVDAQPWCCHCFARYNCGGGCLNGALERGNTPDENYCRFFRQFLRKVIIDRTI